jgi:putative spermidine/putrescine transport system substrate-binding protein
MDDELDLKGAPAAGRPGDVPARSVSRRSCLAAGGAIAAGAFLSGCARAAKPTSGSGGKLNIIMTPFAGADLGVMPTEFAKYYEGKHSNVSIKIDNTVLLSKQVAAFKVNPDKPLTNLCFSNGASTAQGKATGMYAKLDYGRIQHAADLAPNLVEKDHCGVVLGADQMGLVYNTGRYPNGVRSWSDLWADNQRGQEAFFTIPWWAIGVAASLNGGSWADMDAGFRIWTEHAKNIRTIVTANPQFLNVLSTGEAPLTSHYFGTSHVWISQGAPLKYTAPTEGAVFDPVGVNISSGSSDDQIEVMYDMINEMITPQWNSRWADTAVEIPALRTATIGEKLKALPQIAGGADQKFVPVDWDLVGKNLAAWTERWNKDVVSKI